MLNDVVTLKFAEGKTHKDLFYVLSRTIGSVPINEELIEQLFSLLKYEDGENRTDSSTDIAMRFKVNILSELRSERLSVSARESSTQVVFKARHTRTLQQVSHAVQQMLDNSQKYATEKMIDVPGRRTFQGALKLADATQGDRMVAERLDQRAKQKKRADRSDEDWTQKEREHSAHLTKHEGELAKVADVTEVEQREAVVNEVPFAGQKGRGCVFWSKLAAAEKWTVFKKTMPLPYCLALPTLNPSLSVTQFVRREKGALVDQIRVERRRTTRAKSAHDVVSAIKVLLGPVLQGRVAKTTDKPYQLNDESWQWYRGYTNDKKSPIDEREKLCPSCNCVRHAGGLLCFLGHKNSPERKLARGLFFFRFVGNASIDAEVERRLGD